MTDPDPVVSIHDAVLALIKTALGVEIDVFDSLVPKEPPKRFVVLYSNVPTRSHEDLGHTSDTHDWTGQVTYVDDNRWGAQWLGQKVRDALVDVRPNATALGCGVIEQRGSQPVRQDEQVPDRQVMFGTDQYAVRATANTA